MMSRVDPPRRGDATRSCPSAALSLGRLPRVLIGLLSVALAACGGREEYPQTMYHPRSDFAIDILRLQNLTLYMGIGVGVITFAILAYILLRFRHRPGAPEPKQVHGNTTLELAWTLIPAVLIAIIAVPTARTIFATYRMPENALQVDVRGYQWWWRFAYPLPNGDTVVTANEIHVPVGQPVILKLDAADVIHSFWVPQMGGKRDVIPNRTNYIAFTPMEAGVYLGQCAEFCGDSHALMKMRLIAHEPAEFAQWLAHQATPAPEPQDSSVLLGKQLVTAGACAGCHIIQGTNAKFGVSGPDLTHLASRSTIAAGVLENNAQNLKAWIYDPPAVKPGSLMPKLGLSEQEIEYIVAYLQTLY